MHSLLRRLSLEFDSPETENAYQRRFRDRTVPIFRASIILATLTFAVFGLTDLASDTGGIASTRFRYMVACPVLLSFLTLTYRSVSPRRLQALLIAFSLVASVLVFATVVLLDAETEFKIARGNATPNFMLATAFTALLPLSTVNTILVGTVMQVLHALLIIKDGTFSPSYVAIALGFENSVFVVVCFATYWRERLMRAAFADDQAAERERDTMQAQLLSFMSLETVTRSADVNRSVADVFGEVTVLFCDLVGFTQLAERVAPKHLVELLTRIFSRLDELAAEHNVEKVKTIGDAYMAITGTSDGTSGEGEAHPAEDMADFALAIRAEAERLTTEFGYAIRFRIGMHTGSLIGGMIGKKKRSYDYWGRTVNVASRLEASAAEGAIQVSKATYYRLKQSFALEPRGEVSLRGIGVAQTYVLLGRRTPLGHPDPAAAGTELTTSIQRSSSVGGTDQLGSNRRAESRTQDPAHSCSPSSRVVIETHGNPPPDGSSA